MADALVVGLPNVSCSVVVKAVLADVPAVAVNAVDVMTSLVPVPAVLVSEKFTVFVPEALAPMFNAPATVFAVNTAEVAKPLESVVALFTPPANVIDAP